MSIFDEIREASEGATPGPWVQNHTSVRTTPYESSVAVCVASGTRSTAEASANAHLIALAPRMAEIVLAAEKLADAVDRIDDDGAYIWDAREARAAFRKAVEGDE